MDVRPVDAIVFFDGLCVLCNGWVDFLLRADKRGRLRFAPLQGETARTRVPVALRDGMTTLVMLDARGLATRSEAVLRILEALGRPWRSLAWLGRRVPGAWRDRLYDAVAVRRTRWFGRRETCRVPTLAERARFLD